MGLLTKIFYNSADEQSVMAAAQARIKCLKDGEVAGDIDVVDTNGETMATLIAAIVDETLKQVIITTPVKTTVTEGYFSFDEVASLFPKYDSDYQGTIVDEGTCGANADAAHVILADGASTVNDTYNGMYLEINKTSDDTKTYRMVKDYTGASLDCLITTTGGAAIDAGYTYKLYCYAQVVTAGICASNLSTTAIKLATGASATDNFYAGMWLIATTFATPHVKSYHYIKSYVGSTQLCTVDSYLAAKTTDTQYVIVSDEDELGNRGISLLDFGTVEDTNRKAPYRTWAYMFYGYSMPRITRLFGNPLNHFTQVGLAPSGTGTNFTIVDTGAFTASAYDNKNQFAGVYSGTGAGQRIQIITNTTGVLTTAFHKTPTYTDSLYNIGSQSDVLREYYWKYAILSKLKDLTDDDVLAEWEQLFDSRGKLSAVNPYSMPNKVKTLEYEEIGRIIFEAVLAGAVT